MWGTRNNTIGMPFRSADYNKIEYTRALLQYLKPVETGYKKFSGNQPATKRQKTNLPSITVVRACTTVQRGRHNYFPILIKNIVFSAFHFHLSI